MLQEKKLQRSDLSGLVKLTFCVSVVVNRVSITQWRRVVLANDFVRMRFSSAFSRVRRNPNFKPHLLRGRQCALNEIKAE